MKATERLLEHKIVAIFRGLEKTTATEAAECLVRAGIRMMEVTMNTNNAADTIRSWRKRFSKDICIGAGTVLDIKTAQEAVSAGAQFLISPNLDEEVISFGKTSGVDVWPGVMTPTEIVRAWKEGARVVKLFPMRSLGIDYLKEIRAPLDRIPIMATGGINLDNIGDFLRAGASAVGLGSSLLDKSLIEEEKWDELEQHAARFVEAVRSV